MDPAQDLETIDGMHVVAQNAKARRVVRGRVAFVLVAFALGTPGCATWPGLPGAGRCTPRFDLEQGWLGGDAAYSVALPDGAPEERRTLWLFGDTFVAPDAARRPRDRTGAAFVHNSIGISRCQGRRFEIAYHWGTDDVGRPQAFIDSNERSRYWWLFDGFVHDGALYVGLLEVEAVRPQAPLWMPFALRGMSLARIDDPSAPPASWQPRVMSLSRSREGFPGAALHVDGDHLLLFSFQALRKGQQPRFLARLPLAVLAEEPDDLEPHLETLTADGRWTPGFLPGQARILMPDNSTEMSVALHPELPAQHRWLAVYGSPLQVAPEGGGTGMPSRAIYARSAPRPEGPWSERVLLHEIPELRPTGRRGPGTICYAAKEHPAFAAPRNLLLTYVCNLQAGRFGPSWPGRLQHDLELYVPQVVSVETPPALLGETVAPPEPDRAATDR